MPASLSEEEQQLQAALEGLRRWRPLPSRVLSKLVVTGSGFWGPSRLAIRELADLAGFRYSGDLVRGPGEAATTHLVLLCSETAAAAESRACPASKRQKAAEWRVPIVSLSWLLDSIAAGQVQPVELYQVSASHPRGSSADSTAGPVQQSSKPTAEPSCQQLPLGPRPSSVGSSVLGAAGVPAVVAYQADAADAHGSSRVHQEAQQAQPLDQPAHNPRQPLAPAYANVLLDQLRRMSISPEPPLGLPPPAKASGCPQLQRQPLGQPADSPPLHRSPSLQGSPQRSLSLQGLVMQGSQQGTPAESGSREHVAAVAAERRQSWVQQSAPRPERRSAPSPAAAFSPMQQSPAAASPAHLGSSHHYQQQSGMPQQPSDGTTGAGALPFDLGPTRLSDDLPGGSPMAESPAASSMHSAGMGGSAALLRRHSRLAGTPASSQGSRDPMCTLPTPACIRDWSEDDSPAQGSAAPAGSPPGITQTPPDVRQALAAAGAPTQWPASAGQQQEPPQQQPPLQQQEAMPQPVQHESQQQQSPQVRYSASIAGGERMHHSTTGAAAVQDWSDDETVASEDGPQGCDIIVPDSEPMGDSMLLQHEDQQPPSSLLQLWQPEGKPEGQREQQPVGMAALQPPPSVQQQERQPSEEPQQQPRQRQGLLQVSRTGQQPPRTAARVPAVSMSKPSAVAAAAGAQAVQPAASAASPPIGGAHDDAMGSPGFGCEAAHPASSCRSGSNTALPGVSKQQKNVQEWSEDSSSDEFPTPTGQRRQHARGLTGLTQLDSIVIARPRPAGSTATWRSGEAGGASSGGVVGIKFLQRPPRGNAVRTHHGVASLKNVQFAEQVQVAAAGGLVLSTKDKKTAVRLQPGGLTEEEAEDEDFQDASTSGRRSSQGSQGSRGRPGGSSSGMAGVSLAAAQDEVEAEAPVLAEAQTFYRLPDGSWWLEYCRFFTAAQAEQAAAKAGRSLVLPLSFDRTCELLKAVGREHGPMIDIAGGVQVRRVKQGSTALRLRGGTAAAASGSRSYFWRLAVDTDSWRVLTDRPPADFVAVE